MNDITATPIDASAPRKAFRKILHLTFPAEVANTPMVCNLARLFDLSVSILRADITPRREGYITVEIFGDEALYKEAVSYLKSHNVKLDSPDQSVFRDDDVCVHCGVCTAVCPKDALALELNTRSVSFDQERCAACGLCTRVCPVKAMRIELNNQPARR